MSAPQPRAATPPFAESPPVEHVFIVYGIRVQRLRNVIRLAIALLLAMITLVDVPEASRARLMTIVLVYAVLSAGALTWWTVRPPIRMLGAVSVIQGLVDILAVFAMLEMSDGAYLLLLVLFFMPLFCAFNIRKATTAITVAVNFAAFAIAAESDPVLTSQVSPGRFVVLLCAHFLVCAAVFALTYVQNDRAARIGRLINDRSALLAETMSAEERQRRHLAEALHDGPLQSVYAARQDLEEYADSGARDAFRHAEDTLTHVVRELRHTTYELHPAVLEAAGLAAAIESLARAAEARARLTAECRLHPMTTPYDTLLFSVARELITNVVKHARASRLCVELAASDGGVSLTVTDDGKGFDPARIPDRLAEGHIGLASQRVRVEAAHGSFTLLPVPRGTSIRVFVPLAPAAAASGTR
ncbi:ATP-binding protein [Streptomyces sp. NPDC020742]|uniref:sensor histidine kinase n=1 Tax=unclassified Streptomyces TaxID=2593676 RepID=UPI0033EC6C15